MTNKAKPQALVFDCDGVLLDSNRLKTDSFRDCLLDAGHAADHVEAFLVLQKRSFGLSRYRLFEMFFTEILGRDVDRNACDALIAAFGEKCRLGYLACAETEGCRPVLERLQTQYRLYVASGSDEAELRDVFAARDLARYFVDISGSPTPKKAHLQRIAAAESAPGGEPIWFVGDAKADYDAAQASAARFLFIAPYSSDRSAMEALAAERNFPVIQQRSDIEHHLNDPR